MSITTKKAMPMRMKHPSHPGRIVRGALESLGLSVTAAAAALDVSRQTLNNLVNGRAGISPEMAVRLSKALGGGAEMWLRLQLRYDLAQIEQDSIAVKRIKEAA